MNYRIKRPREIQVNNIDIIVSVIFHNLLLWYYLYHCVWSGIIIRPNVKPHYLPPKQHSTYNCHLSLLLMSVMYT